MLRRPLPLLLSLIILLVLVAVPATRNIVLLQARSAFGWRHGDIEVVPIWDYQNALVGSRDAKPSAAYRDELERRGDLYEQMSSCMVGSPRRPGPGALPGATGESPSHGALAGGTGGGGVLASIGPDDCSLGGAGGCSLARRPAGGAGRRPVGAPARAGKRSAPGSVGGLAGWYASRQPGRGRPAPGLGSTVPRRVQPAGDPAGGAGGG